MNTYGISDRHVIAANEGNTVALAAGYHLATGGIPVVYLQNGKQVAFVVRRGASESDGRATYTNRSTMTREDLGGPITTAQENKENFMRNLK